MNKCESITISILKIKSIIFFLALIIFIDGNFHNAIYFILQKSNLCGHINKFESFLISVELVTVFITGRKKDFSNSEGSMIYEIDSVLEFRLFIVVVIVELVSSIF